MRPAARLLLIGAVAGPPPAPAAGSSTQPTGAAGRRAAMSGHFLRAKQIQAALIRGDLSAARTAAGKLVEPDQLAGLPPDAQPHLDRLTAAAERVARAADLAAAAAAAGAVAQACGGCHSASAAELSFASGSFVPSGAQTAPHMLRHRLAADRMWEGLIGPSDAAWQAGAELLDEDPIPIATGGLDPARAAQLEALARQVHRLGARARAAGDHAARAELYAQFLAACSGCHSLTGVQVP